MPEGQESHVTARVLGTFGYFDPEYTSVLPLNTNNIIALFTWFQITDKMSQSFPKKIERNNFEVVGLIIDRKTERAE